MHHSRWPNFRKFVLQLTRPMHLIRPNTPVWVHFIPFYQLKNNQYKLFSGDEVWMHHSGWPNFRKMFRNERVQCTLFDPKLAFGCILFHFITSKWPLWSLLTQCIVNAPFRVTEFFLQWTHPMHLIRPKTHVWVHFVPFSHFQNDRYYFSRVMQYECTILGDRTSRKCFTTNASNAPY